MTRVLLGVLVACGLLWGCGARTWGTNTQDGAVEDAAEAGDGQAERDSRPDRWQPPESAPPSEAHDFCDASLFFLPKPSVLPAGDSTLSVYLGDGWTNLGWSLDNFRRCSLVLYDLEHCVSYQVAPDWWEIRAYGALDLAGNGMVVSTMPAGDWVPNGRDLYFVSFETWERVRLTHSPDENDEMPVFNGRYVAWIKRASSEGAGARRQLGLWLLDLETMEATMLDEPEGTPNMVQINERYVVWNGWGYGGGVSYGRDVFYYDLETGDWVHVEASQDGWVDGVDLGGHWIGWSDSLDSPYPPYRLWVYDIETGEATKLAEEPDMFSFGMSGGIVVWTTYAYCGQECYHLVTDYEAYDVRTGVRRRLTTRPYPWGSGSGRFDLPWLMVGCPYPTPCPQGIWLFHFERFGIVDEAGYLIPGEPVIEPPPRFWE